MGGGIGRAWAGGAPRGRRTLTERAPLGPLLPPRHLDDKGQALQWAGEA